MQAVLVIWPTVMQNWLIDLYHWYSRKVHNFITETEDNKLTVHYSAIFQQAS